MAVIRKTVEWEVVNSTSLASPLEANTFYTIGDASSLTVTLPSSVEAIDEFTVQFNATADFTVSVPSGTKTLSGAALSCTSGNTYILCIRNGLAILNEFS